MNKKMKLLIISDSESMWIKSYIEKVLLGEEMEVFLLVSNKISRFSDFYQANGIRMIETQYNVGLLSKIPKIRGLVNILVTMKKLIGKFDIIHVHGMNSGGLFWVKWLKRCNNKIIGSYWGSDIFRLTPKKVKEKEKFFKYFDEITLLTKQMFDKFHQLYSNRYDDKLREVRFGISGYEVIQEVLKTQSRKECKNFFSSEESEITVAIGYNSNPLQQHLEVIKHLAKLPKKYLEKITLIFQMTYGGATKAYKEELKSLLDKMDCRYVILDSFLSDHDIARLRLAVDIFIHGQTTDALSGSIQEYLFAGAVVLNPIWIQYDELLKGKIDYIEYSSFEELPRIIEGILNQPIKPNVANANKLLELSSWSNVKQSWLELYKMNDRQE